MKKAYYYSKINITGQVFLCFVSLYASFASFCGKGIVINAHLMHILGIHSMGIIEKENV